jgi:hypothetical protein
MHGTCFLHMEHGSISALDYMGIYNRNRLVDDFDCYMFGSLALAALVVSHSVMQTGKCRPRPSVRRAPTVSATVCQKQTAITSNSETSSISCKDLGLFSSVKFVMNRDKKSILCTGNDGNCLGLI